MAEVISVHVGQCGNQVGAQFWQLLHSEHGLDQTGLVLGERTEQLDRISSYFSEEERGGRFVPRSVLVDLEPGVVERVVRSTFRPENCVTSQCGAANNWARAYHGAGAELMVQLEDVVRPEASRVSELT